MEQLSKEPQKTVTGSGTATGTGQAGSESNINKPTPANLTNVNVTSSGSQGMPTEECSGSSEISKNVEPVDSSANGKPCSKSSQACDISEHQKQLRDKHIENKAAAAAAAKLKAVPEAGRCQLYITKKQRYCRSVPNVGKKYCLEHLVVNQNNCSMVESSETSLTLEHIDSAANVKPSPKSSQARDDQIYTSERQRQLNDKLDAKAAEAAAAKAAPMPGRCQLYLSRKRRYCRSVPNVGKKYCVEHSVEPSDKKRVQCPLDPKHTCYEGQLKNHLKKCNARREALPIYYVENLNAGNIEDGEGAKVAMSTVEPEEIKLMIAKVNQLYEEKVKSLKEEILCHAALQEEIDKPTNGPAAQKHLKQQASLVGHVDKHGLLHDECCYIEFGAGKAGLSHWVQRAQDSCNNTKFVLVDKSTVRYKMDVYHRGEDQGPDFERLRIDIQHLDLNKVPCLIDNQLPLVGLGKHLCGGATDLMLRCLMQTVQETTNSNQKNPYVEGLVVALCCHHRCDWTSFVGKQSMRDWGVGPREFGLMTSMTSWATCATRTFLQKLKEREAEADSTTSQQEEHGPVEAEDDKPYNHPRYGSLTPEDREEVGFKCKRLLDMARVYYLREHGFNAELLLYAQLEHTLENVVLVANNSKHPEQKSTESTAGVADP